MSIGGHVFFTQFLKEPHSPGDSQSCGMVKLDFKCIRRIKKGENRLLF